MMQVDIDILGILAYCHVLWKS